MITRWTEVARRTAERLGLPYEVVKAAIEDMAKTTAAPAKDPTVMETDCMGLGVLELRYGKLLKRIPHLRASIAIRERYMARQKERGLPEDLVKVEKHLIAIPEYEKNIEVFEEFIRLKGLMYGKGKEKFINDLLEDNGLTKIPMAALHRKGSLSGAVRKNKPSLEAPKQGRKRKRYGREKQK